MATPADIRKTAKIVEGVGRSLQICQQIAAALIETDQEWIMDHSFWSFFVTTEYERARNRILKELGLVTLKLDEIRKSELSPDAIRAHCYVLKIAECCRQCPEVNRKNLEDGKPFKCLAEEYLGNKTDKQFRFKLTEKGHIFES